MSQLPVVYFSQRTEQSIGMELIYTNYINNIISVLVIPFEILLFRAIITVNDNIPI